MRSWVGVVGCIAFAVSACATSSVFNCDKDSDCAAGEGFGVCQPTGYCSFSDPSCDSGQRYGSLAGEGLAKDCVPTEIASGTGGETSDETSGVTLGTGTMSSATTLPVQTSTTGLESSSAATSSTATTATTATGSDSTTTGIIGCNGFVDDFENGVVGNEWVNENPLVIEETDGELRITVTTSVDDGFANLSTFAEYDLSDGDGRVQLATPPAENEIQQALRIYPAGSPNDELYFMVEGDQLRAFYSPPGGADVAYMEEDFEPETHRWLRMRGAGEIANFEFSDDGEMWQTFASVTSPIPLDDVVVALMGGNWALLANETVVSFEAAAICP